MKTANHKRSLFIISIFATMIFIIAIVAIDFVCRAEIEKNATMRIAMLKGYYQKIEGGRVLWAKK